MKFKRFVSSVMAAAVLGAAVPVTEIASEDFEVYASEEAEYTEGTYGVLTYKNYGNYVEISDCDSEATEVEIPSEIDGEPVTRIGEYAFNMTKLEKIIMPDTIQSIGSNAFSFSNLSEVIIPNSVVEIGECAFMLTNITEIIIPDSVTTIGEGVFLQCENLKEVKLPDSLTILSPLDRYDYDYMFGVTGAFLNCYSLEHIVLPEKLESIASYDFAGCTSLKSIVIQDNMKLIEWTAFSSCDSLTDIYFTGSAEEWAAISIDNYDNCNDPLLNATIHYNYVLPHETSLGDIDGDSAVNSSDASRVLTEYALIATGAASTLTEAQFTAADVNKDGAVDSSDASTILAYYAYTSTGGTDSIESFIG